MLGNRQAEEVQGSYTEGALHLTLQVVNERTLRIVLHGEQSSIKIDYLKIINGYKVQSTKDHKVTEYP